MGNTGSTFFLNLQMLKSEQEKARGYSDATHALILRMEKANLREIRQRLKTAIKIPFFDGSTVIEEKRERWRCLPEMDFKHFEQALGEDIPALLSHITAQDEQLKGIESENEVLSELNAATATENIKQLEKLKEAREVLRSIEWSASSFEYGECPSCCGSGTHEQNCALFAILDHHA